MGLGRKEHQAVNITFKAGGDLSSGANTFVKIDSNGEMVAAGDGEEVLGVLMEDTADNAFGAVAIQNAGNIIRVKSGAAVTQGSKVASNSAGKCIDAASGDIEVGVALEGSTAEDEYAIVQLTRGGTAA